MKCPSPHLALAFFLASASFAQQNALPQADTNSPVKSQDWIKNTLIEHATYKQMEAIGYISYKIDAVSLSGCTLTYRSTRKIDEKGLVFTGGYTLPLIGIDPEKIAVKRQQFHYSVSLPTRGGKKLIKLIHTTAKHGQSAGSTEMLDKAVISFNDESEANEIAKALREVIKVCQSQK
jgi:hypothetical protein